MESLWQLLVPAIIVTLGVLFAYFLTFALARWIVGLCVLALALSGCALSTLGGLIPGFNPDQMQQVKALQDANLDVYVCLQIAGPPPVGGLNVIGVPKGREPNVMWGGNCQPIGAKVNVP